MPHLDASALESDPECMAFLREVIGKRPGQQGSWTAASTPPTVQPQRITAGGNRGAQGGLPIPKRRLG